MNNEASPLLMEIKIRNRKEKKDRSGWTALTNSEILSTMQL